jgi:hypothetical protein
MTFRQAICKGNIRLALIFFEQKVRRSGWSSFDLAFVDWMKPQLG